MMMERLRAGANSLVVKIILGLIILSFVFAGVGGYIAGGTVTPAAEVGDVEISQSQFEQAFQNERQQMQAQAGEFFSALLNDPNYLAQFRRNVLDRMINNALLDQHAEDVGLRVSDEQIKSAIREMGAFNSNGIFNNDQYLASLRRIGLTPEQFAEYVRQDIEREHLVNALQESEFVLNGELETLYRLEDQTRTVRTLNIPVSTFTETAAVTAEAQKAYYDENPSQFMRPEQFKISYLELSGDLLTDRTDVSEDEARKYYQDNIGNYGTTEKRKVSHIMIEGDDAEAKAKAEAIIAKLAKGADFAETAKTDSDDTFSAEQGGSLDWFDKGVMDPAFEEAAYKITDIGELSEVVKSEFGYHIIKLDEIKAADVKPYEVVSADIIKQLKQQNAAEQFYELSTKMAEKAFEMPDNLDDAANEINTKVSSTDFVALSELSGVLANPAVVQAIQSPEVKDDALNSELIEIAPEHVVLVRVDESRPQELLPFDDVKEKVTATLKRQAGEKAAEELSNTLLTQLNEGNTEAFEQSGYVFDEAKMLLRSAPEREVAQLAFTMPSPKDEKSTFASTRQMNGDFLIVALDEVKEPEIQKEKLSQLSLDAQSTIANTDIASVLSHLKEMISVTYSSDLNQTQ